MCGAGGGLSPPTCPSNPSGDPGSVPVLTEVTSSWLPISQLLGHDYLLSGAYIMARAFSARGPLALKTLGSSHATVFAREGSGAGSMGEHGRWGLRLKRWAAGRMPALLALVLGCLGLPFQPQPPPPCPPPRMPELALSAQSLWVRALGSGAEDTGRSLWPRSPGADNAEGRGAPPPRDAEALGFLPGVLAGQKGPCPELCAREGLGHPGQGLMRRKLSQVGAELGDREDMLVTSQSSEDPSGGSGGATAGMGRA